jgi:60 kDa SS-A/Ro ribonucleoprotein
VRRGIEDWLTTFKPQELAYQFTKYRNRNGFTPRDVLRLTHPKPAALSPAHLVYAHATQHPPPFYSDEHPDLAAYLAAAATLRDTKDPAIAAPLIREHRFSWEHVGQQQLLKDAHVWQAILDTGMPYTALLRNLRRLVQLNMFESETSLSQVTEKLANADAITHSRAHPIQVLQAIKALESTDAPQPILTALNTAFDAAFKNIEPTYQRFLLAIDVSGSMHATTCAGMRTLTAAEGAAATALAFMRREPFVIPMAFSNTFMPFPIRADMSIHDVLNAMHGLPFSNTDCSAPMRYALEKKLIIDTFVIITDNETNCNTEPPAQVLRAYRQHVHPTAKLVILATSATNISIADPQDAGMLDIVGMDAGVFQILRHFCSPTP